MKTQILCAVFLVYASVAYACNIPVFRYALERWKPDQCQLIVFHETPLDEQAKSQIENLRQQSTVGGGNANTDVLVVDVRLSKDADQLALWKELKPADRKSLPYALVRTSHPRGPINAWHGQLSDVSGVLESPLRKRLSQRLLSGDSVVWLLLKSPDEARNEPVRQLIKEQSTEMEKKLKLPDGIGLPGSELHSEVPLFLKFTMLELDREDVREQFLIRLFSGLRHKEFADNQPLVIPVFGRGRALEVIPSDQLDAKLFEELTLFLCGACSCQVKESNPGFDLLLSANWNVELFGEDGPLPPPPKTVADGDKNQQPKLLPIAPGRKKP